MSEEELRKEQIELLIRFYNMQTGKRCKSNFQPTVFAVSSALDRADGDIVELKNFIRDHANEYENDIVGCFDAYQKVKEDAPEVAVQPKAEPTGDATDALNLITRTVSSLILNMNGDSLQKELLEYSKNQVKDFIQKEYGAIERKITTIVDDEVVKVEGVQHEKFEEVVKFVANDEPVFLTGPAGSGKNVLCQQVAKALGLDFYFSNAVTQEYKITGFTDANGTFHESQFYKAFKNGGLFMLDEMDASIPEVLVVLNAAIANRYFDFPAPIGYVQAHKDFRVIAAGNTFGLGANYEYVGRNQLDMASLDRFAVVKIGYSLEIEKSVANGDIDLVNFATDFRHACEQAGAHVLFSYRSIGRIAKMQKLIGLQETLKTCLLKGMDKDDLSAIISNLTIKNTVYYHTLKDIQSEEK